MDFSDCNSIGDIQLKQELLQLVSVFSNDKLLYHYTSAKGIESILQDECIELRFTRVDCVNDTTEGTKIIKYYKNVCKKLLKRKSIDEYYYNLIINVLPLPELTFIYKPIPSLIIDEKEYREGCISEYVSYVFCFSKLSDSLPMWNYYLKNGKYEGYNLGFSPLKLKEAFHHHPYSRNFISSFIVVEYDDDEKDDIFKVYIQGLYEFRHEDGPQLTKTKLAISQELFKWQYAFKSDFFSHEEEVRLIIHVPLNENKTMITPFTRIDLSYDNIAKIPKYIFVPIFDKKVLCEITMSPMFNKAKQKMFLKELLIRVMMLNLIIQKYWSGFSLIN